MGQPLHVYPDPNGGDSSATFVPSDTRLAGAAILSGGVAVGAAATGSGTAVLIDQLLFYVREAASGDPTAGFLGIHASDAKHVAVFLFFASLSVLLQVINLVKGIKMKRDLLELSEKVNTVCKSGPPTPPLFDWWKTYKAGK